MGKITSESLSVSKGVPQGSSLGPILFLIYINDLVNISSSFTPILYADDTTLIFSNKNVAELLQACKNSLVQFQNWSIANKLTININKCSYMMITNQVNLPQISLQINNIELERADRVKFLGVFLDDKMKFMHHTDFIANKISRSIGIIYRIKDNIPQFVLKYLYNSLILPYLTYCITVWGGTFQTHLDRLCKLQKRAIRLICNKSYLEHTNPLFNSSPTLKLEDLFNYHLTLRFYKTEKYVQLSCRHKYSTRDIMYSSTYFKI